MKLVTKFILISFSVLLYVGAVFLLHGSVKAENNLDSVGQVLGVSEATATPELEDTKNNTAEVVYFGLPDSRNRRLVPDKKDQIEAPAILSKIAVVMDERSGSVLYEQNSHEVVPIASISKLATALVFLEEDIPWDTVYEMGDRDRVTGGRIYLHRGDKVKVRDLFSLSLMASANTATQALVYSTGLSNEEFLKKMNEEMQKLGLTNTHFEDVTGLSVNNKSTALEVAKLAKTALAYPEIMKATMMKDYKFKTEQGEYKYAQSTDSLLNSLDTGNLRIMGGKTGYTDSAGYCFVGRYINQDGNEVLSVVLREESLNARFENSKKLALWAFDNYLWN